MFGQSAFMNPQIYQRALWITLAIALLVIGGFAFAKWQHTEVRHLEDYGAVPNFSLLDQSGSRVSLQNFKGHIWVADMVFTQCESLCPRLTEKMQKIAQDLKNDPNVRFLSVSVDPRDDPPDTLLAYAIAHRADTSRWTFLTGSTNAIYELIKGGFHMPLDSVGGQDRVPIIHSPRFLLFDARGHMRGYYNGVLPDAEQHILADVSALEAEAGQ